MLERGKLALKRMSFSYLIDLVNFVTTVFLGKKIE